jgi:hypothetical protein
MKSIHGHDGHVRGQREERGADNVEPRSGACGSKRRCGLAQGSAPRFGMRSGSAGGGSGGGGAGQQRPSGRLGLGQMGILGT